MFERCLCECVNECMYVRYVKLHVFLCVLLKHTTFHVRGHRHIDLSRVRKIQIRHNLNKLGLVFVQTWIVNFLHTHGALKLAFVIVSGVHNGGVRQRKDMRVHGRVQLFRTALLEICSAASIDHQRIPRKHPKSRIVKTEAACRVPRSSQDCQCLILPPRYLLVGFQQDVGLSTGRSTDATVHGTAVFLFQRPRTGDVIGVAVRVQTQRESQTQGLQKCTVTLDLLEHWIDENAFFGCVAGNEVGERGSTALTLRLAVKQLVQRCAWGVGGDGSGSWGSSCRHGVNGANNESGR